MPWVLFSTTFPLPVMRPVFTTRPLDRSVKSPACAPSVPALLTPTPYSFETSRITPLYMPPNWLTSIATVGAAPSPAIGEALSVL